MVDKVILSEHEGNTIHLERYYAEHLQKIHAILDQEIGEMLGWEVRRTPAELAERLGKDLVFWSIFLNDELVGGIFLDLTVKETNVWTKRMANIGYFMDMKQRKKGCISAVVPWVINHAFKVLGIKRIKAGHLENNSASKRIIEKNGFGFIGIERNYAKPASSENYLNHYLYDLIPEDLAENIPK